MVYRNDLPVEVGVGSFVKGSCNGPAGYAELAGAQLAWLATVVPSVVPRWGFCDAGLGTVGRYVTTYTTVAFPNAERDGPYYWGFGCEPYEPPVQG